LGITTSRSCPLTEEQRRAEVAEIVEATQFSKVGVRGVKERLALEKDIRIPRAEISTIMKDLDPEGFLRRTPGAGVVVRRTPAWGIGPWSQLSVDGHDKLRAFGIYIYGWRDSYSGFVMRLYMGRSNRNPHIINREMLI